MDSNIKESSTVQDIYDKAEQYWTQASEDVDGMLGGFANLHKPDVTTSNLFIKKLQEKNILTNTNYAIDCGAGIGRVDMVDVAENLIAKSDDYIGKNPRLGEKFVEGLQTFTPPAQRYDMIWIQWVSGHLTDDDFISFFKRCQDGLRPGGVIVLKDNLASSATSVFDSEDHSWTRPESLLEDLFEKAGLRIVARNLQTGFPKGMYKVKLFALKS